MEIAFTLNKVLKSAPKTLFKWLTFAFALLLCSGLLAVDAFADDGGKTVTIGTDTQSNYLAGPYGATEYECSLVEMLYTADEIGDLGSQNNIAALAFNVVQANSFTPSEGIMVYMANTKATSLDSDLLFILNPDEFTLVYDGAKTIGQQTGWESIELTDSFSYEAGSNLAVIILRKGSNAAAAGEGNAVKYAASSASGCLAVLQRHFPGTGYYENLANALKPITGCYYVSPADQSLRPNIQLTFKDESTAHVFSVADTPYAGGYYLVTYTETVPDGQTPAIDGEPLYKVGDSFVTLMTKDQAAKLTNSRFSVGVASHGEVSRNGDVNGNGTVNIVDAQVAYDLSNGVYADFTVLNMEGWLRADVNSDGVVDSADALAIQAKVMGQ